jgi:hypothetical protein
MFYWDLDPGLDTVRHSIWLSAYKQNSLNVAVTTSSVCLCTWRCRRISKITRREGSKFVFCVVCTRWRRLINHRRDMQHAQRSRWIVRTEFWFSNLKKATTENIGTWILWLSLNVSYKSKCVNTHAGLHIRINTAGLQMYIETYSYISACSLYITYAGRHTCSAVSETYWCFNLDNSLRWKIMAPFVAVCFYCKKFV